MEKLGQGIHDRIPMEIYHDNCCEGPSISASGLIQVDACPVKYWAFSPLNPHRFIEETTKALNLGRAAHAKALGEPAFSDAFIISPYDDFRTKEAREWRDSQTRTVLKGADLDIVDLMARALELAPQVANAFKDGKPEQSLIWKDKETGVWLKSRPDWLPNNPRKSFIVDYKTAVSIDPYPLSNAAFNFGYHVQAALQVDGTKELTGALPLGIAHVCQEKDPPYLAEMRMFTPEHIDLGRKIARRAIRKFADCLSKGQWPGYTTDPQYFETPFRVAKLDEELSNDTFHSAKPNRTKAGNGGGDRPGEPTAADYLGAG